MSNTSQLAGNTARLTLSPIPDTPGEHPPVSPVVLGPTPLSVERGGAWGTAAGREADVMLLEHDLRVLRRHVMDLEVDRQELKRTLETKERERKQLIERYEQVLDACADSAPEEGTPPQTGVTARLRTLVRRIGRKAMGE